MVQIRVWESLFISIYKLFINYEIFCFNWRLHINFNVFFYNEIYISIIKPLILTTVFAGKACKWYLHDDNDKPHLRLRLGYEAQGHTCSRKANNLNGNFHIIEVILIQN